VIFFNFPFAIFEFFFNFLMFGKQFIEGGSICRDVCGAAVPTNQFVETFVGAGMLLSLQIDF